MKPRLLLLLLALALLTGCESPSFTAYEDTGARYSRAEVLAGVWTELPGVTVRGLDDSTYTSPSADWLVANLGNFRAWAWEFLPAYQGQSLDCENFARILREVVNVQAGRARVDASPIVAVVYVEQRQKWGNVPGSDSARHAVNGVLTDRGIYIIEPQSLTAGRPVFAPLAQYPNPIYRIQF